MLPGFSRDVVSAPHAVNNLRAQEPTGPHIYHLTCVSGRLLDKDHNMTLFLFCAGSVNRRKAPAAEHAPVQDIDRRSRTKDLSSLSGAGKEKKKNPSAFFDSEVVTFVLTVETY